MIPLESLEPQSHALHPQLVVGHERSEMDASEASEAALASAAALVARARTAATISETCQAVTKPQTL